MADPTPGDLSARLLAESQRRESEWAHIPTNNPRSKFVHDERLRELLREAAAALSALPAAGGLFALHLMGPDSVYAAPSFEAALRVANAVNLDFADRPVKPYAVVVPWSGDAESHAAGLADWEGTWN